MSGDNRGSLFLVIPEIVRRESILFVWEECLATTEEMKTFKKLPMTLALPKCYRSNGDGDCWNVLFFDVWELETESV